jgi:hypothetical protein
MQPKQLTPSYILTIKSGDRDILCETEGLGFNHFELGYLSGATSIIYLRFYSSEGRAIPRAI